MPFSPRLRCGLALATAAALVLVGPIVPLRAEQGVARDVDEACTVAGDSGFTDKDQVSEEQAEAIDCVAHYGVSQGQTETTYNPGGTVKRDQMASFLVRAIEVAGQVLPEPSGSSFSDVPEGNVHAENIERLARAGIAQGFDDGTYRPGLAVSRAQMASFVARQLELSCSCELPEPAEDYFADDNGNTHEARINQLAEIGVVQGSELGDYGPGAAVTRGQMALFLARDLDYLTEDKGVSLHPLGFDDTAPVLDGPELVAAELEATSGGDAIFRFTFDEEVNSSAFGSEAFRLYTFAAERLLGTSPRRDASDPSSVLVTFEDAAAESGDVTTAAVAHKAVQDTSGIFSPEGSAEVSSFTTEPGTTAAPDLVSVGSVTAPLVQVEFDESAHVLEPTGYHLVLENGTVVDSDAVTSGDGSTTHTVRFPELDASEASQIARVYVEPVTVSDERQVASDPPLPDPVEGAANAQQSVLVGAGATTGPDLVSAALNIQTNQVVYTFDENVNVVANPITGPSGTFRAYDINGSEVTSSDAEKTGAQTVTVTFGSGEITELVAGVSVDAGSVAANRSPAPTNQVAEVGRGLSFENGETAAPDLAAVARTADASSVTITYSFDEPAEIVLSGTPGSTTRFVVYETDGDRVVLTGCSSPADRPNQVACTVESSSASYQAVVGAALGAVVAEAVVDESGDYASYETARAL